MSKGKPNLTPKDWERDNYRAYARNKLIAEAFYLTGDIEKYGSGFLRIRNEISAYPTMKLTIEEIPNGLHVMLRYKEQKVSTVVSKVGEKVGEKISANQLKIIEAMKKNQKITYEELAEIVAITETS